MNAPPTIIFRNVPVRRLGDPFPLSAPSPDDHSAYRVERLAGGGFVSIWANNPDDVRGQLFDANGARIGAEILVNSQDAGTQYPGPVEALPGGGFVVAWTDYEGDAGTGTSGHRAVKAQVFSAAGDKVGAEISVNSAIDGPQIPVQVTALANGNFVIVWGDASLGVGGAGGDTSGYAVKAQLFAGDGSRIGGEILVNTTTNQDQVGAQVTALADGGFVVGWDDYSLNYDIGLGYNGHVDVRVQRFDAAGAKAGSELLMEVERDPRGGDVRVEHLSSITTLPNGNLLVLWLDYFHHVFFLEPTATLLAQILTPAGARVGGTFLVHASTGNDPFPLVQILPGGGFVVAWTEESSPNSSPSSDALAQRFADDGTRIGGEVVIATEGFQTYLTGLAAFANGEIAATYVPTQTNGIGYVATGTRIQLLDASLQALGGPATVATGVSGRMAFATPDGRMMITTGQNAATLGQLLSLDGHLATTEGVPLDLRGTILIGDADAGGGVLTVTLSVPSGVLDVGAGGTGASVGGTGTGSVTIAGTLAQIGALLAGASDSHVSFLVAPGAPPTVTLTVSVNDNGNSGGAAQIATAGLAIDTVPPASIQYGTPDADTLVGGTGIDSLYGLGGNDILIGGAGNDYLDGGAGSDTFYVDAPGDIVVDPVADGVDRVLASGSYTLPTDADIEILQPAFDDSRAMDLTGNQFGQTIIGSDGANILRGNGGDDILYGEFGDDYLVGGIGNDIMYGGMGNDTFYVDSAGDVVNEPADGYNDRIAASLSYVLPAGVEVERLEAVTPGATDAMDLTGNEYGQMIAGTNGVNVLRGEGGNDVLYGNGGDDYLIGGTAADTMDGGAGSDTYYVDNPGDVVIDPLAAGVDRVAASVSHTLAALADIEILEAVTLSATNAMNLIGNQFGQTIIGNAGVNILDGNGADDVLIGLGGNDHLVGGTGIDAMYGGVGNDTYYVDAAGDVVSEAAGEGADRVAASASYALAAGAEIEILEALNLAATDAIDLTGNAGANAVTGNNGANRLDGKGGNDVLTGAGGADTFAFTTALGAGNVDRIADFASGTDKIGLDDAIFGALGAGAFGFGTQAQDADDRIIYNAATGQLFFDADGNGSGAQVLFATLDGNPALAAGDFIVI